VSRKLHAPERGERIPFEMRLYERQGQALMTDANELLYGGAAGGGKSQLMRFAAIKWCLENPGLQVYLFRRKYPDLMSNHMEGPKGFRALLAGLEAANYCRILNGGKEIRFWNGSKIWLRHLQYTKTLSSYQGTEIHVLLMDEVTHFEDAHYRFLRSRVRLGAWRPPEQNKGFFPRIICSANPGGIGHHWVKSSFVDQGPFRILRTDPLEGGMRRQFIPALSNDNPALLRDDPDYLDRLRGLGDPLLVRAMLDGDWDIVAGAMFGEMWRKDKHIIKPFSIPYGWGFWRGGDDGFVAPASLHWFSQNPDTKQIIVCREFYKPNQHAPQLGETTTRIDREIMVRRGTEEGYLNETLTGILDSAAFSKTGASQTTRGQQMNDLGCNWKASVKGPGSRVQRVRNLGRLLDVDQVTGNPGIVFFDTCVNAIRTIPTLPRDENDVEDIDTNAEDHAFDSVTYGLQWKDTRPQVRKLIGV